MLLNFVLMDEEKVDFLAAHQSELAILGFWSDLSRRSVIRALERMYKTEIIREWAITDLVENGSKVLVKWQRRFVPLTDVELKEEYGRT